MLSQMLRGFGQWLSPDASNQAEQSQDLTGQDTWGNAALAARMTAGAGEDPGEIDAAFAGEMREDIRAELDRQDAREELAGKFSVGDAEVQPGQAMVSPEQFEQIVALYSDIRRGKTNFAFDTSNLDPEQAAAFRTGAMGDVASLLQTESGRQLVSSLAHDPSGKQVVLGHTGQDGRDADHPVTKAFVDRAPGEDANETAYRRNRQLEDGEGTHSQVLYAPGHTVATEQDGDCRSDVVLYHELVHAWQNSTGTAHVSDQTDGLNHDEYEAVWYDKFNENLYRSERDDLGDDTAQRPTYAGRDASKYQPR